MVFSLLVTLREGVEMALIVAILLSYLRSIGQRRHFKHIWAGVGLAAVICLAIGTGLELAAQKLDSSVVEAMEGITMIVAVAILTGMALWMRKQSAGISRELRGGVDRALGSGSLFAVVFLAASSVGREGLETTLFLFAGSATAGSGVEFIAGGVLGFVIAALIGFGIYRGANRIPLKQFFLLSGVVVIVMGAGLLANSVVAFYEAGWIYNLGDRPWDTEHLISITSTQGKFLHTLLGYDSAPSLAQIVLYWGYLTGALSLFLLSPRLGGPRSSRQRRAPHVPVPPSA
jgi:high-affinity iron transporter